MSVTASEPAAHHNARMLLRQHGLTVTGIVRVEPDAILYLGVTRCPMTAWLHWTGARLDVTYEPGFPAWPTPGLEPSHILSREDAQADLEQSD